MMNEKQHNRTLEAIKQDMRIITSSKLNTFQSKLLLIGIIYEIIQRRDLFPRNTDLKKFVQVIVVNTTNEAPFRDYLYLSRTLLGSRISNVILDKFEYHEVLKTVKMLNEILPSGVNDNINNHRYNNDNDEGMNDWINFIRGEKQ